MSGYISLRTKLIFWVTFTVLVSAITGGTMSWFAVKDRMQDELESRFESGMDSLQTAILAAINGGIKNYLKGTSESHRSMLEHILIDHQISQSGKTGGLSLEEKLASFIENQRVGATGYSFAVDCSTGARPFIAAHPHLNMKGKDSNTLPWLKSMCGFGAGYLDPATLDEDLAASHMHMWINNFSPTGWIIVASSGIESFRGFVDFGDISQTIKDSSIGLTGKSFVVSPQGKFLMHPDYEGKQTKDFIDVKTNKPLFSDVLSQINLPRNNGFEVLRGSGQYQILSRDNGVVEKKYIIWRYLPDTGWIMGMEAAELEIKGPLSMMMESLLLTAIIVVVMVAFLLVVLTRPFFSVISEVTNSAHKISEGDFEVEFQVEVRGRNEIAVLAKAFVAMKKRIADYARQQEQHRKDLEKAVRERTAELERANQQLEQLSITDGLTGLGNRRHFDRSLQAEFLRTGRSEKKLGLLMIDIDHFKLYNDCYGHPAGDVALQHVSAIIRDTAQRQNDQVFRYGGEEFSLIAVETDLEGLTNLAEKICHAVFEAKIPHERSPWERVTVSIGLAVGVYNGSNREDDLVQRADEGLYQAKEEGRNRVVGQLRPVSIQA